jgi:hypothetical protein
MKRLLAPLAIWLMFGSVLAWITSHAADWFVMTDELVYERLASSVDRLFSPVPRVHGAVVAKPQSAVPTHAPPVFATAVIADGLHRARRSGDAQVRSRATRAPDGDSRDRLRGRAALPCARHSRPTAHGRPELPARVDRFNRRSGVASRTLSNMGGDGIEPPTSSV